MKTLRLSVILAAVVLRAASDASAQSPAIARGDISGTLGIEGVDAGDDNFYRGRNFDGGFFGAVSAGWYWTDNLKSEVEFGARAKTRVWLAAPITIAGVQTYYTSEKTFSRRTIAVGQQYQFFHNVWFHPHVGAGANLTFERSLLHTAPVTAYDPVTRTSRIVNAERADVARTDFRVNPYVDAGFKAYMTPRTFFRTDLRVGFHRGVDDVVTRFGFGFDF